MIHRYWPLVVWLLLIGLLLFSVLTIYAQAATWTLVFADEFTGGSIDTATWNVENSTTSFYGGTLQAYRPENVTIVNGALQLASRKENVGGKAYTSGAVTTKGKQAWAPPFKLEIRAQIPSGTGIWPAIWMEEGTMPNPVTGAEIDIMEGVNGAIYETHHLWTNGSNETKLGCSQGMGNPGTYHIWALEVDGGGIRWYLDGAQVCGPSTSGIPTKPSYLLLNTSIGGSWPGPPDSSTPFPQYFVIDFVRVYNQSGPTNVPPSPPSNLQVR